MITDITLKLNISFFTYHTYNYIIDKNFSSKENRQHKNKRRSNEKQHFGSSLTKACKYIQGNVCVTLIICK